MKQTLFNCTSEIGIEWHRKEPVGYYFGDDGLLYKERVITRENYPFPWGVGYRKHFNS